MLNIYYPFAGAITQIIPSADGTYLQMELRCSRAPASWLPFSQPITARSRLSTLLQVILLTFSLILPVNYFS